MLLNAGKLWYLSMIYKLQSLCIAEHNTNAGVNQVMLDGLDRSKRPQDNLRACSVMLMLLSACGWYNTQAD